MQHVKIAAAVVSVLLLVSQWQMCRASDHGVIPVQLVEYEGHFQLLRGGKPYEVRGAGLEFSDVEVFASHGGNSIRTWRTDNALFTGQQVLDEAERNGVTVALCIEIGRERHGFDYNDEQAVAVQLEYARGEVMKYKDHPALLVWVIGNEANLFFKNPKVFDAINDISRMIHEVDGNHPTTTALSGFNAELSGLIETRSPDLDFISIQMYGDIVNLPKTLKKIGYNKPYFVTEWGAIGHWEVPKTSWGAPIEQNSSAKATNYHKSYEIAIASDQEHILGSYVFLWGQKQEQTPTWYAMFLPDGTETETIDVMHYIWTGDWPNNRSPQIQAMLLDSRTANQDVVLQAGSHYEAQVSASDPEADTLEYRWEIMRENEASQEGGDPEETPESFPGLIEDAARSGVVFTSPAQAGPYRLFVYIYDGHGHAAHANIPFLVQ